MLLRWIETFVETARLGSVTAASHTLRVTQPAVSHHLKLLQAELGAELYKKGSRGIVLTRPGKLFLENSETIFRQITELKNGMHDARNHAVRTLKLGGSYSSTPLLARPLASYKKQHPEVEITLRTDSNRNLSQMVIAGDLDIGMVKAALPSSQLKTEMYRREQLVLFALPTHPLTRASMVTPNDLAKYPLVIRHSENTPGTAQSLLRRLQHGGLHFHVALRCQTPASVMDAVRNKIGVGLLYRSTIEAETKRGNFNIIRCRELKLEGNSFIIYNNGRPLSPWAAAFLNLLRRSKRH